MGKTFGSNAVDLEQRANADPSEDRLGWIGAGRMGAALVERLLDGGRELSLFNRTSSKAEPLRAAGATLVDSAAEVADRDIVFTIVTGDEALKAVTLGPDGLLSRDAAPAVIVDSSTVSTAVSEEVRHEADERGTMLLAAPVSGNPDAIRAGNLAVVASGPEAAMSRAEPHLDLFGSSVTYVGEGDAARFVKICHNLILLTLTASIGEVLVLAERAGISRADFLAFLNSSVLGSTFTGYKTRAFSELDFSPTATTELLAKDADLGLDAARALSVELPLIEAVRELLAATVTAGFGESDFAAMIEVQAQASGVTLAGRDRP
ncbi:MAG: NAD(P)-dependent oxidoreductase [Solirubrobacterales bacterium]